MWREPQEGQGAQEGQEVPAENIVIESGVWREPQEGQGAQEGRKVPAENIVIDLELYNQTYSEVRTFLRI